MWTNTWRGAPTMPPFTHLPMSDKRCMGYVSLQITLVLLGHVSLGELNMGHFHRGHLSGGASLWGAFLGGLFFGIPKVSVSYK